MGYFFLYFLPVVWHSDDGNLYVDIRLCMCVYQKAFQLMRWLLLIVLHASTLIPKMVYGLRENDEPFHQLSASQVNANLNHVVPNSATRDFTSVFYMMAFNLRPVTSDHLPYFSLPPCRRSKSVSMRFMRAELVPC